MKLSLRQLQIFCAISQHGTTTSAGAAVSLSQSAASAALNELENVLGVRLFDRVGKRLLLNDNGHALFPQAKKMLESAQLIEDGFLSSNSELSTRIRVGCSTTIGNYVLPLILAELRRTAPLLRIDVEMGNTATIARKVASFDIDIGLIEGACHLPELTAYPWLTDEMLIVAGKLHPFAKKKQVTLDDLRSAEWLLREPGSGTREEVEQFLLHYLHELSDTRQVGSSEAIKHLISQDIGVSCLSRWVVADKLGTRQLRALSTTLPPLTRRFYLIRHRDKYLTQSLEHFWSACADFKVDSKHQNTL